MPTTPKTLTVGVAVISVGRLPGWRYCRTHDRPARRHATIRRCPIATPDGEPCELVPIYVEHEPTDDATGPRIGDSRPAPRWGSFRGTTGTAAPGES